MNSRLADLLLQGGHISEEQCNEAKTHQSDNLCPISTSLISLGFLTEDELTEKVSDEYGLPLAELTDHEPDPTIIGLIPKALAYKNNILALEAEDNSLSIAMVDPSDIVALNDIKFITGFDLKINLAKESQIKALLEKAYEESIAYDDIFDDLAGDIEVVEGEDDVSLSELERQTEDAPVVKLVNAILQDAIKKGASDIHVEPYEKSFRVRFRIDGVLYEIMKPPIALKNAMTSRMKIMANLDIAERRLPQDGRIKLKIGRKEMDYRVSVLPGLFGEKIVLRLLDKSNLQTDMLKLGFREKQLQDFLASISKPYGLVLVTGPTGSGKTTTLYSALSELNKNTVNLATAEDPVEFNLHGINQVQMHEDIGLNFAAALRSFLRQDPDVIMVGEIRDYETAEIAIKASLTGHLVLSTLHTNDAPSTINRLLNMGVEPFLVSSSINIVVAQRLARRICENCKERIEVSPEVLVDLGISAAEAPQVEVYHGTGCGKCNNTGYKGRVALYECMLMSEPLKECILNGASANEIKEEAIRQGMLTLRASGNQALKEGTTTIEEVLRVTVE